MVFGIVALGLLNGLLFLPVYLSCKSSTGYIILYTVCTNSWGSYKIHSKLS